MKYLNQQGYSKLILRTPAAGFPLHQNPFIDELFEENVGSLLWVLEDLAQNTPAAINYQALTGELHCDLNLLVTEIQSSKRYRWLKFGVES
jgi:hypothetical protein